MFWKHIEHVLVLKMQQRILKNVDFANDFHMDVKVVCNDETITQKPLPRATESAQINFWIRHLVQNISMSKGTGFIEIELEPFPLTWKYSCC